MAKNKTVNESSTTVPTCIPPVGAASSAGKYSVIDNNNSNIKEPGNIPVIIIESKVGEEQKQ